MRFRIEIRDRLFVVKDTLDDEAYNINWAFSRIGGCGEFNFDLPRKRLQGISITGESNLRIYKRNNITGTYGIVYQGLINNKVPNVRGNSEDIGFSGHGYINQLSRIKFSTNTTYTAQEASIIIKNILDTYLTYTNVTYSASDIEATTFTFDTLEFKLGESILSAIKKISDTVGSREYGVDQNRKFYFKQRSSTIGFRFLSGVNITNFQDNQDFSEIVNQVFVQGAQAGGTYYTSGAYNDLSSQSKYNLRTELLQNSSVSTNSVAEQLATAYLSDKSEVSRRASCSLINYEGQLEATIPIPLFSEISRNVKYGQKKYGTFLYSGTVSRVINRINYSLTNNNSLKITLDLGQLRPNLAEDLKQLEYKLDQTASAAL